MTIRLSGNLLRFSNFHSEIEISAPSVISGLQKLVDSYPDLRRILLDGNGGPRAIHRLFLNGDLLMRDDIERAVTASDELSILTALAGG